MARRQTTATLQTLFGQRLRLERRNGGATIYARTFLQGRGWVRSTGERTLSATTPIATDGYLGLLARARHGENLHGRYFADLAEVFCLHAEQVRKVCEGQRRNYRQKWNLLKPRFNGTKVADVDARFLHALRDARSKALSKHGRPIKPATLKKDLDFVRLVLRHAKHFEKCLTHLPEFPSFAGRRGRSCRRRARFSALRNGWPCGNSRRRSR